jgi:hypothetical protein
MDKIRTRGTTVLESPAGVCPAPVGTPREPPHSFTGCGAPRGNVPMRQPALSAAAADRVFANPAMSTNRPSLQARNVQSTPAVVPGPTPAEDLRRMIELQAEIRTAYREIGDIRKRAKLHAAATGAACHDFED